MLKELEDFATRGCLGENQGHNDARSPTAGTCPFTGGQGDRPSALLRLASPVFPLLLRRSESVYKQGRLNLGERKARCKTFCPTQKQHLLT